MSIKNKSAADSRKLFGKQNQRNRRKNAPKRAPTAKYDNNDYLSLLLDPANAPLVGIPDQITVRSSVFKTHKVTTITADAAGNAAFAWSPALSSDLLVPTIVAGTYDWSGGNIFTTLTSNQLQSITGTYSDIRPVAASITVNFRGTTLADQGMYSMSSVAVGTAYEVGGVAQSPFVDYSSMQEAAGVTQYTARDSSITSWYPEGFQSFDYNSTDVAGGYAGELLSPSVGWVANPPDNNTFVQIPCPTIAFAASGLAFSALTFEIMFDVVYEAVPYIGSMVPTSFSPSTTGELDHATNVIARVPPSRNVSDPAGDPNARLHSVAQKSTTDIYNPSISKKAAQSGESFWTRAKKWLSNVDWGAVATTAGSVLAAIL